MIDNYNKCCQNGEQKKEEFLSLNSPNNCKFFQIKDGIQKNYVIKSKSTQENFSENETNFNKINIFTKNEDKKLDLKDTKKGTNEAYFLNKKKRRIAKKIFFKHRNVEININELFNIIHTIMEEVGEKFKLLINSQGNKKFSKNICKFCHRVNLTKENKMISFSSPNDFKDFYDNIFNIITNDEYKQKIAKISQEKYNIILENQKEINNIKINNIENNYQNKNYCFICIYNSLIKNRGITLLWENFCPINKKMENKTKVEDILINSNINTENIFNEKNNAINNIINNENINKELNINDNFDFNNPNEKRPNIFDLILGDENDDNNLNDLENLSDDNKSIKNKNNDKKLDKKNKKNKIEKKKENKILFTKTRVNDNNELGKINFNSNINNFNKANFEVNDKKKNINIINMNNINNINQFNAQKFLKKNDDQTPPLLFNVNHNPNSSNSSSQNILTNNNAIGYLNSINNNAFLNTNDDAMYNKLNDQLTFLKNKLSLESNLNDTRIDNLNNMNNDVPILISNADFKENLLYFKNSMQSILTYMDNLNNMLDKYSCINEQSLYLIDSMINGNIGVDDIMKLKNNNNHFSDILNYNYKIKKMNSDLCDKIINYLNH